MFVDLVGDKIYDFIPQFPDSGPVVLLWGEQSKCFYSGEAVSTVEASLITIYSVDDYV